MPSAKADPTPPPAAAKPAADIPKDVAKDATKDLAKDVAKDVADGEAAMADNAPEGKRTGFTPTGFRQYLLYFLSTGGQFILLGCVFLAVAQFGLGNTHTTFSFVLVVLGSAILLYGTGTHGVGTATGDVAAAKYNVSIAGGAGIMSLAIGYAMVHFEQQMRKIFAPDEQYVFAVVEPNTKQEFDANSYFIEAENGMGAELPTRRAGRKFVVMVPYTGPREAVNQDLLITLRTADPAHLSPLLEPVVRKTVNISFAQSSTAHAELVGNSAQDVKVVTLDVLKPALVDVAHNDSVGIDNTNGGAMPFNVPPVEAVAQ